MCPLSLVHIYREAQSVSCLVVVSTRTSFLLLHAFTRCCGELRWRRASRVPSFISLFRILLPRCQTYFCSPLCRFATPTPTPILRSASPPLSITSLRVTIRQMSLQQDVCWRLILGYNRWYFFFLISIPLTAPFAMSISILLTFAELCGGV